MLDVPQAGVLTGQLLTDAFVLWMLGSQHQARVVAQFAQVLQSLRGDTRRRGVTLVSTDNTLILSHSTAVLSFYPNQKAFLTEEMLLERFSLVRQSLVCLLHLEDVACGLQFGLFLLFCSRGDAVVHTGLGSGLGKVFIQLNLWAVRAEQDIMTIIRLYLWKIVTLLPKLDYLSIHLIHNPFNLRGQLQQDFNIIICCSSIKGNSQYNYIQQQKKMQS